MNFSKYLAYSATLILVTACSKVPDSAEPMQEASMAMPESTSIADTRPNILFIVADDLGFTDIGAFGSEIATPVLDELAHEGLRINNLHAGSACQQTRTMLMASTGHARGVQNRPAKFKNPIGFEGGARDNLLKLDFATIPELLQDAGYATYMTGKWDLGWDEGYTPATRGFDHSFVQLNGASSYFAEEFETGSATGFEDDGNTLAFSDLSEDFYVTDHYTNKMLEYLEATEEGQPWFAYMPYTAPHWPLQLPEEWLDLYAGQYEMGYDVLREQRFASAMEAGVLPANSSLENFKPQAEPWDDLSAEEQRKYSRAMEIYAAMIAHLDMSIGRIISHLEETAQMDNTVIVFTSDHGASSAEHGVHTGRGPHQVRPTIPEWTDNSFENFGHINSYIDHGRGFGEAASAPFRYLKGSITEGGLRAASFIRYPAKIEAGGVTSAYMTMMDILPTFMDIAGTEHPGAGSFRGREVVDILGTSAWPLLTGQADAVHGPMDTAGWSSRGGGGALIRGDYKLINAAAPGEQGLTEWRLYNLVDDPGEHFELSTAHPELVAELVEEWETNWR